MVAPVHVPRPVAVLVWNTEPTEGAVDAWCALDRRLDVRQYALAHASCKGLVWDTGFFIHDQVVASIKMIVAELKRMKWAGTLQDVLVFIKK